MYNEDGPRKWFNIGWTVLGRQKTYIRFGDPPIDGGAETVTGLDSGISVLRSTNSSSIAVSDGES